MFLSSRNASPLSPPFQGPAATNVPECVYGVIDLYGQAAQATIMDLSDYRSPEGSEPTSNTVYSQVDQVGQGLGTHSNGPTWCLFTT